MRNLMLAIGSVLLATIMMVFPPPASAGGKSRAACPTLEIAERAFDLRMEGTPEASLKHNRLVITECRLYDDLKPVIMSPPLKEGVTGDGRTISLRAFYWPSQPERGPGYIWFYDRSGKVAPSEPGSDV